MLEDFKIEFEYELFGTLENSKSIIGEGSYNLFSDDERYLYYFSKKHGMSLFVNLIVEGELIFSKQNNANKSNSATLANIGGELRGTILDRVGFYLRGTNGIAKGDREAALLKNELKYNFKFNEKPDENFFDETQHTLLLISIILN